SLGILNPASMAARITEVPAATVTLCPSTSSVTRAALSGAGVPKSISLISGMAIVLSLGGRGMPRPVEILGEMAERAQDRQRGQPAQRAERGVGHGRAEVFQKLDIGHRVAAGDDLVDHLDPAGRADAAGGAFAAGFDGAERHGEAGLAGEVDAVV